VTRVFVVARSSTARARLVARCRAAALDVVGDSPVWSDALASQADVIVATDDGAEQMQFSGGEEESPALVVLSDDDSAVGRAAASGAHGWAVVPTAASPDDLSTAAVAAERGFAVAAPAQVAALRSAPRSGWDDDVPPERLTAREREVLELVSQGQSNRGIANALGISEHTVKFHLASIFGKLGASTRTEAVRRGLRRGLITI
jgi:DNA-binding NarL/FixJ family response regulator